MDKIKFYMSMVLPLYSENMVLRPKLRDSWDDEVRMAYTFYVNLTGHDAFVYGKGIYSKSTFNINFKVLKIVDENVPIEEQKRDQRGYNRYYDSPIKVEN